jgi:hypothetical protein
LCNELETQKFKNSSLAQKSAAGVRIKKNLKVVLNNYFLMHIYHGIALLLQSIPLWFDI